MPGIDKRTFEENFTVFTFKTSFPSAKTSIASLKTTVNDHDVDDEHVSRSQVYLLPKAEQKTAQAWRTITYAEINRIGLPVSGQNAARIIPKSKLDKLAAGMLDRRDALREMASAIADRYDDIVADMRTFWLPRFHYDEDAYQKEIGRHFQGRNEFRDAFSFSWANSGIGPGSDAFILETTREFLRVAWENAKENEEALLASVTAQPVMQLTETLERLKTSLTENKRLSPKSLTAAFDAIKFAMNFESVIGSTTLASLKDLERELEETNGMAVQGMTTGRGYTNVMRDLSASLVQAIDRTTAVCREELDAAPAADGGVGMMTFDDVHVEEPATV